jgi:hypothetical protein
MVFSLLAVASRIKPSQKNSFYASGDFSQISMLLRITLHSINLAARERIYDGYCAQL